MSSQKNKRKNTKISDQHVTLQPQSWRRCLLSVERSVQNNKMVVKMNQPIKKRPNEFRKSLEVPPPRPVTMLKPPGVRMMAKEIQKPPQDESAVAPNVFPTAISLQTFLDKAQTTDETKTLTTYQHIAAQDLRNRMRQQLRYLVLKGFAQTC